MRVLFIGDIVGRPGRRVLGELLPSLRSELALDVVVANIENSASGFGVNERVAEEIFEAGVDIMTGGNHLWDKRGSEDWIESELRLVRPANYPPGTPGKRYAIHQVGDLRIAVLCLQGRVFMPPTDCPVRTLDGLMNELEGQADVFVLDFHAEATSEKLGMGRWCDGRLSAVVGTHTHVPTADGCILPGGTGYITDLGLTGAHNGVLGMKTEGSLRRLTTSMPTRLEVADGDLRMNGFLVEIDPSDGHAISVGRIQRRSTKEST